MIRYRPPLTPEEERDIMNRQLDDYGWFNLIALVLLAFPVAALVWAFFVLVGAMA